jgi:hypothetical protein
MNDEMSISTRDKLETYVRNCQNHLDRGDLKGAKRYFGYALEIVRNQLKLFALLDFTKAGELIK